jgi:hypothetical protein
VALVDLDPDVADGFDTACSRLGAELVTAAPPDVRLELGFALLDIVCTGMLVYHRRFAGRRGDYRTSIRGFLEYGENRRLPAEDYVAGQSSGSRTPRAGDWFDEHHIDALVEPTVPIVARPRGRGDEAFTDVAEISLTHY